MPRRSTAAARLRRRIRHLRTAPVVWWAAAFVAAAANGLTVDAALSRAGATAARFGTLERVPVVAEAVPAGAVVPRAAVRMEWRPVSLLPEEAAATGAAGRTALVPLVPGEVLVASRLAPEGLRGAAALLPPGMRAIAVPVGAGGRPTVDLRDRVDLLATFGDAGWAEGGTPTVVVAAGALVVAVDREAGTVTVAVPAPEAPAVAAAITTAHVTLALAAAP